METNLKGYVLHTINGISEVNENLKKVLEEMIMQWFIANIDKNEEGWRIYKLENKDRFIDRFQFKIDNASAVWSNDDCVRVFTTTGRVPLRNLYIEDIVEICQSLIAKH